MRIIQRIQEIGTRLLRYIIWQARFHYRNLGWPVAIDCGVEINLPEFVSIGDNVLLARDVWINIVHFRETKHSPKVSIDARTSVGRRTTITCAMSISIGKRVMLGPNCFITDHNHNYENVSISPADQGIGSIKPVTICDDVWIGTNVVILPGVTIGKHSVVGANSVVTRSVPAFSVVAGSPAKLVKSYNKRRKMWVRST